MRDERLGKRRIVDVVGQADEPAVAGRPEGRDEEFYFQAEEELRKLLEAESPGKTSDK